MKFVFCSILCLECAVLEVCFRVLTGCKYVKMNNIGMLKHLDLTRCLTGEQQKCNAKYKGF